MEVKTNKINDVKQEVEFEVSYADLAPHFEKAYKKFQRKAEIPGFRKGKAPVSILKRKYGEMIEQGSLEDVANDVFRDYLKDNHVHPLGEGSLVDMDYQPQSLLTFKVRFEVKPEINLAEYKGVEVNKTVYRIDDKMIEDEIKYLRSKHVTYEDAQKAEGSENVVTLDVQKLDDTGVELIGQSDKDVRFYLNDPQINKEFKEQLDQITPGEERILMLNSPNPEDNGKIEKYKVHCIKIEKIIFPELNEEFFKKTYNDDSIKTIQDFRTKVKTDLEGIYKNISDQELRNNIVNELIKLNDVPVPDTLVENILDSYIEDTKNQNPKRQLPKEFDTEEFRKTKRVDAILQVKWYLIRDKIIVAEKIEVSDDDLLPVIEADAKKYNLPVDKIRSVYEKNPDVKYRILDDKLMKFLIDNAKVKEVERLEDTPSIEKASDTEEIDSLKEKEKSKKKNK
jgi:trigger factor